jgi:hypothetical protein
MNSIILKHYQDLIQSNLKYLEKATIKSSLDDYRDNLLRETAKLHSESDRNENKNFLDSFYNTSIDTLEESGKEMNMVMKIVVNNLTHLNLKDITESIQVQLLSAFENFNLKDEYHSFNGLLFEYDSSPSFSGMAFKEPQFEIILDNPKHVEFIDGSYASDNSIDFELEEFFEPVLGEPFEETAWAFEFELDLFLKVKETAYSIVSLCLHEALKSEGIKNKLNECGFESNGVVYLNEHDMELKTVFVNA